MESLKFTNFNSTHLTSLLIGAFVIHRLQDDMKFSAAGEVYKKKYIWQSLVDWKTWVASMLFFFHLYEDA